MMRGPKQYGKAAWGEFTQKPRIITNEKGEATISTFKNTIGIRSEEYGFATPIVKGFNDMKEMMHHEY